MADPAQRAADPVRAPALRQPQRRRARVRHRRPALHRAWATAARAATRRATARTWARCWARCCASTWTGAAPTASRRTTRSRRGRRAREVWAYGLRNPWRFAFDRAPATSTSATWARARREEVDVGLASRRGGENYGWNVMEGTLCFRPSSGCNQSGPHAAGARLRPQRRRLLGHRRRRVPRLPHARLRGDLLLRATTAAAFVRSFRLRGRARRRPARLDVRRSAAAWTRSPPSAWTPTARSTSWTATASCTASSPPDDPGDVAARAAGDGAGRPRLRGHDAGRPRGDALLPEDVHAGGGACSGWSASARRYTRDGHALWLVSEKGSGLPSGQVGLVMQTIDGVSVPEIGVPDPSAVLAAGLRGRGRAGRARSRVRPARLPSRGLAHPPGEHPFARRRAEAGHGDPVPHVARWVRARRVGDGSDLRHEAPSDSNQISIS